MFVTFATSFVNCANWGDGGRLPFFLLEGFAIVLPAWCESPGAGRQEAGLIAHFPKLGGARMRKEALVGLLGVALWFAATPARLGAG